MNAAKLMKTMIETPAEMPAFAGLTRKFFIGKGERAKSFSRQICALGVWLGLMFIGISVALLGVQSAQAFTNPITVDFNAPSELTGSFNDGYGTPSWSQNTSGGIAGGGGITIPNNSSDLYICKQGFPMQVGATYTVGAYFYNYNNSGYGGLGFTTLTSGTINGGQCTPLSAIGVSIHGGGGFMDNNSASTPATTSVNWNTPINPGDYYWFYFKVTLTCTSANTFSQTMEIWQCDTNGNLGTKRTTTTVTGQVNATLGAAATIYPFFGAAQSRFTAADSFTAATTAPNPTKTWSGASGVNYNWNTAGNWVEAAVPATGDDLVFPTVSAGRYNSTNNISGLTLHLMTFTAGGYSVSGNALSLSAGVSNSSGAPVTFNCPLTLTADQAFNLADNFVFTGNLTNNFALTVNSAAAKTVAFQGIISGTGIISKAGFGSVTFSATNTYTGGTTLSAGRLDFKVDDVLGSGTFTINGGTTIDATAANTSSLWGRNAKFTLLNNPQIWNGDFTFAGTATDDHQFYWSYTLDLGTGPVTLNANCQVTVTNTLTVGGVISGSGYGVTKAGDGTLNLTGNNTYTGPTTVNGGTLVLSGNNTGPIVVNGGTLNLSGNNTTNTGSTTVNNRGVFYFSGNNNYGDSTTVNAGGDLELSGNNNYCGPTTVNGGYLLLSGNNNYADSTTVNGGTLLLIGNNNYCGPTTINAGGTLELDGSIAADSVITIASGAELTTCNPNYGYYTNNSTAAGTLAVYGRLFPGGYPGYPNTLNTGSETWYGGTHNSDGYVVSLNGNLAGAPGVDWPWLNITGTLNIAATSDHPFSVWPSCNGSFNNVQDYTWRIATASGGVVGFDASKFTIRMDYIAGAWPGLGAGQFIVTQSGNDVNLQFFHVIAHPVTAYRAFGTDLRIPVTTVLANVSGGTGSYTLTGVTSRNTNDFVRISGTNILFAPADPNAPSSTLDYFVQSLVGVPAYTNSGTLTVVATNAAGISRSITVGGGTPTTTFAGMPGSQYMVQRSTDLINWTNLDGSSGTTNSIITTSGTGVWTFTDPNPPEGSAFYRTVQANFSVVWGGLNPTYDGTAKSVTAISSPPGMTVDVTYNGSSVVPTNAGSYTVVGTISHGSYSGSATNTLTIAKATATITLIDNGDGTASATTSPPGLVVGVEPYNGYAVTNPNSPYIVVTATISDPNYTGVAYGSALYSNTQNQ
jgi:autotransporter-associated beta strand protein